MTPTRSHFHSIASSLALPAYAALIAFVSLSPSSSFERPDWKWLEIPHADKAVHFLMYAVLAAMLDWFASAHFRRGRLYLITLVILCAIYGLTLEALQHVLLSGDRIFSTADMLANALGAAVYAALRPCKHRN